MTTVVDGAAGFGWIMDGTEILPFRGAHFRARLRGTWRVFGEKGNDEIVDFHRKKTAEFVEPERPFDALRRFRKLYSDLASNWNDCTGALWFGVAVV